MINLNYDKQIKDWIDKNRDLIIRQWIEISKIPAIKSKAEEDAPFGKACADALNACAELFADHDFDTEVYTNSGYALVNFGEGEKTIGLFGHSDVVPVGDDWIYTKPFEPVVIDGTLIGRGVEDNKSGIIAALCAMEIIREYNIPLKSRIQAFIGSEEETGMTDIETFAKEQPMPDVSLVLDADFPCSIGEKSICHFWAKSKTSAVDIIDFNGGAAFNVVLDKATATIKASDDLKAELNGKISGKEEFTLAEEKGVLILTAKGMAKHACAPDGSVNAAKLIAELLCGAESLNAVDRQMMAEISKILGCHYGTTMGLDHNDIRFGKLTFVNGMVKMCDGKVCLSFDTRYGSTLEPEEFEKKAEKSFNNMDWEIEIDSNMKGFSIADDSPIPDKLVEIYNTVTGFETQAIRLGGGTYARKIENAFSVGTKTSRKDRKAPFMEMPAGHGGAHQSDEMIDLEAFFDAVRVITHYIINIDECL